jgi:hypothetical protein
VTVATIIFRCPSTGAHVQGWFADNGAEDQGEGEIYHTITCIACQQVHLVNRATGKTLGAGDE